MDLLKNRQRDLGGLFLVVGCSALSSLPRRLLTDAFDVPVRGGIKMRTAAVDHPFERSIVASDMPSRRSYSLSWHGCTSARHLRDSRTQGHRVASERRASSLAGMNHVTEASHILAVPALRFNHD